MKRTNVFKTAAAFVLASFGVLLLMLAGCQMDDRYEPDPELAGSAEMEAFILAAIDLQQTREHFEKELNKIDFSTLKTVIVDGRQVTRLPKSVRSVAIEDKLQAMNSARSALLGKFPRISSFDREAMTQHFEHSMRTSARIGDKLLLSGAKDLFVPAIKTRSEYEWGNDDSNSMNYYLYAWCSQPADSFVEILIIQYIDGTWATYQAPDATYSFSGNLLFRYTGDNIYFLQGGYPDKPLASMGHTHTEGYKPTEPTYNGDGTVNFWDYHPIPPGVTRFIYYNGEKHYY